MLGVDDEHMEWRDTSFGNWKLFDIHLAWHGVVQQSGTVRARVENSTSERIAYRSNGTGYCLRRAVKRMTNSPPATFIDKGATSSTRE